MKDFILFLIKYTALFICILYAYTRLLRVKLKAWDLLDIPIFIALSAVLYFVTVYIKILVPAGFLIFGTVFLFLRFRRSFYETVTVATIALGISIVLYVLATLLGFPVSVPLTVIKNKSVRLVVAQLIGGSIQVLGVWLLFRIKRLRSGIYPKSKNATFDILLYISVICIFTMTLLYAEGTMRYMYKVIILVAALGGLLLIFWWRRHITYNYREAVNKDSFARLEKELEEHKLNSAEKELQLAVYAKLFHYLNKAVPDCALLAETSCADECAVKDMLQRILREMNLANEKCSLQNIPQTGIGVIDAPIIRLFTSAENKNFNASAEIFAPVEGWFADGKLDKDDIHILLAYLCDNAVNSALGLPNAKVRVELDSTENNQPLIRVYDSGEQFDENVLARLGLEQITTRAGLGGNGIGLFTVFEIMAKYGASFVLDEASGGCGFTKCIEIAFDGRRSVTVRTCRDSVIAACSSRKDMTVDRVEVLRDGTNG